MNNSQKRESIFYFLPIILINLILIFFFLNTYIESDDVHFLFTPFMFLVWFFSNLALIIIMGGNNKRKIEETQSYSTEEESSNKKGLLISIISKFKYIAIAYVNYLLISSLIRWYVEDGILYPMSFIYLFIYNLFCFGFISIFRKSRDCEFYSFIMIILPVLVGFVWYLIV